MNPELRRHVWLELNLQRLLLMPTVLGLLFMLIYRLSGGSWQALRLPVATIFVLLTVLWGGRRVHGDVQQEVAEQTWDSQRMSTLGAWSLTWGKLLGAPLYAWYGGAICLAAYTVAELGQLPLDQVLRNLALLLLTALFVHGLALFGAVLAVRNRIGETARRRGSLSLFGLLAVGLLVTVARPLDLPHTIEWYGYFLSQQSFVLFSLLSWVGWVIYGAYRLLRVEQGYENGPVSWVVFTLFCASWVAGLLPQTPALASVGLPGLLPRSVGAFVVCVVLTYVALFAGDKRLVTLLKTTSLLRARQLRRGLYVMPRWIPAYVLALVAGLCLTWALAEVPSLVWMPPTALVFMLRDVFFVLWLSVDAQRHAGSTAVVVLALAYGILPALLMLIGWETALSAFLPSYGGGLAGFVLAMGETSMMAWVWWLRSRKPAGA